MTLKIEAELIEWRGPAPFVFLPLSVEASAEIRALAATLTYGWGVIPVTAEIGQTSFTTSLIPRNGVYLLPVKVAVQRAEQVAVGDRVLAHVYLSPQP